MSAAEVRRVEERLSGAGYLCDRRLATCLLLAMKLGKPVLVEGPAGVGKTELAKAVARAYDLDLIRLQCYEGLDESKALYEWEYAKQLLYSQMLRDRIREHLSEADTMEEAVRRLQAEESAFFSEAFLIPRPLLRAIRSHRQTVLLIDEVDRSDEEFEAFLLEILSDFQVSIPELGTLRAVEVPICILTSNNSREVSDALRRRCLHLFIPYPSRELEEAIVRLRVPEVGERLLLQTVAFVQQVRQLGLRKAPGVSETLDWVRSLVLLQAERLDPQIVEETLNFILKHEEDVERIRPKIGELTRVEGD